ncbi:protein of unknown function [Natronorubrum texcoconense]|uniref:DUF4188 domain-containing protein n=2 Tax=Natronorubrum texcoconense TaxID=1095776 RepID=A0A1G8Y2K0_9EURY|nr:protein of unknown function [Natronorubrum texcoconense]
MSVMQAQDHSSDGVTERRVTAEREDAFVVFHIGMRINALWKIHRWLPMLLVAPRMVRELVADPGSGLLGSRTVIGPGIRNIGFVQYWESFGALEAYARDGDRLHRPAWQAYYGDGTGTDASVGIWHETYLVDADEYETVYNHMPAHGLAACDGTEIVSATERRTTAAGRLGRPGETDTPADASESSRSGD